MSKTTENIILIPGASGWEIWTSLNENGYMLHSATDCNRAGEIRDLPPGDVTMLFPARSLTAVPMRVNSDDDLLFPDLAALHAERLGLRPDPMAGQLTDVFVIAREPDNTALVSVFLRIPGEGELPIRAPKGFDISARAIPVFGDLVAIWQEFGRWVFATYHHGTLVYCQATSVDSQEPNDALAREIRMSLMQLSMQGLDFHPTRIVVWTNKETLDTSALTSAFEPSVEVTPRPAPVLPAPLSKLLPADVKAARRAAQRRLTTLLVTAAVLVFYIGVIGWFSYDLWKTKSETRELNRQANTAAPDGEEYTQHIAKWEELSHVIDLNNSPVDILSRIASCIPPNSGLRLKTADISATEIKLIGEAPQLPAVNTFSLKLSKSPDLMNFKWQTPEPNNSNRGWEFVYSGEVPTADAEP